MALEGTAASRAVPGTDGHGSFPNGLVGGADASPNADTGHGPVLVRRWWPRLASLDEPGETLSGSAVGK